METEPHGRAPQKIGTRARIVALVVALAVLVLAGGCAAPTPPHPDPAPATPSPGPAALTGPDVTSWLDGLVPAALDRSGIAGAAVTVVHDGRVIATRGYGWADTGTGATPARTVDPDRTLFRLGSVSKVFTATAVLQLAERGAIDLDADVSRYLDVTVPRAFDGPVTMRHLLTHTAGFEERVRGLIGFGERGSGLRDTVAVDPPAQVFAPGTVPAYSNYGYALAGYVVQRVSGMPFEDYVASHVLAPAGMTSSSFAQPLPPELRLRLAQGYPTDADPAAPFEVVGPAPAGALSASPADMGRFMLAQLGAGPPALGPDTLALMRRPALDASSLGGLAGGRRMGLGLFDESRNGHRIVGHGGDTQYFHSHLQLYPDDATGVFVTMNSTGRTATDSLDLRESLLSGFADRYFPAPAGTGAPATTTTAGDHAARAAGNYESARSPFSTFLAAIALTGQTTVTARPDGTLLVTPGPGTTTPAVYREVAPWVWQEVGAQRLLAMRVTDGRVAAIGHDSAFTLLRAGPTRDATVVLPILGASVAVLLLAAVAWPAGAVLRRRYARPAPASLGPVGDMARRLTRGAAVVAVLALAGWAWLATTVLGLQDVPGAVVGVLAGTQWLALLGLLPAAVAVVAAVRHRAGRGRIVGSVLLLLALVGVSAVAAVFGLLTFDASY